MRAKSGWPLRAGLAVAGGTSGIGSLAIAAAAGEAALRVPAEALFCGDNRLLLSALAGAPTGARLQSYRIRGL